MSLAVMKYPGLEDWVPRHRITVDEYHRMARVGLLAPDARVELIEGEIIKMAPSAIHMEPWWIGSPGFSYAR
jgi:Uma2 family endonuclease